MTNANKNLEKPTCNSEKSDKQSRNFLLVAAISAAALILAEAALTLDDLAMWIKIVLAVAHVPFTVLVGMYGWRVLMAMDELQRHIHMQSFVFGITAAAVYLLTSNLLNEAGIGSETTTWMFWPMLWLFYSIRYSWLTKSYRG